METEDEVREKEQKMVKDFIGMLDEEMGRKLAIRSLRRGIGSMDYIDTLLIMEDDLDEDKEELGEFGESSAMGNDSNQPEQELPREPTDGATNNSTPDWCVCDRCRPVHYTYFTIH